MIANAIAKTSMPITGDQEVAHRVKSASRPAWVEQAIPGLSGAPGKPDLPGAMLATLAEDLGSSRRSSAA
jgi:hypothetical protein